MLCKHTLKQKVSTVQVLSPRKASIKDICQGWPNSHTQMNTHRYKESHDFSCKSKQEVDQTAQIKSNKTKLLLIRHLFLEVVYVFVQSLVSVSYTHLTLPTTAEV